MSLLGGEKSLGELEEEKEEATTRAQIAQQKEIEAEAKRRYGSDWKKMLGNVHSGINWDSVKFKLQ